MMKEAVFICLIIFFNSNSFKKARPHLDRDIICITEVEYNGTAHFKVETPGAVYFIEKQSGGCSSMIDPDGNDWIAFRKTGDNPPLNSADSDFRGLPNLVHKQEDAGVGHPGFNKCETEKSGPNILHVKSNSGLWDFTWTFHAEYAVVEIHKTDTTREYWFLYEGPTGGKFRPESHYWGNDVDGVRFDAPVYNVSPASGNWRYGFFGDKTLDRVLYVVMPIQDTIQDFFAYMGNDKNERLGSGDGMTVFGFGRAEKPLPLLDGPNKFIIGFYEKTLLTKKNYTDFKNTVDNLTIRLE